MLVFLVGTKASTERMKGFQNKLGFTQGIVVPSNGRSGGLALLWREGTDIRFKICSHSHIDVVVHGVGNGGPWRATGFYRHPDTGKRYTSWQLIETLSAQCNMPWLVCGDLMKLYIPMRNWVGRIEMLHKWMLSEKCWVNVAFSIWVL